MTTTTTETESIPVTRETLRLAFLNWELENRNGLCRSPEETAAMSPEDVAAENVEHFWDRLHG